MTNEKRQEIEERIKHLIRMWNQAEEHGKFSQADSYLERAEHLQKVLDESE